MGEANEGLGRMTDDKLNNVARAMAFTVIMFILLLVFIAKAFGQVAENHPPSGQNSATHSHENDSFERFEKLRLLPPAQITYIEPTEKGRKIEYIIRTRLEVRNGSFTIEKGTKVEEAAVKKGRMIWILYCSEDGYLVSLVGLTNEQERAMKR